MPKKDTRRKMLNPNTGRKVYIKGAIGRSLRKEKNRKKARLDTKKDVKKPSVKKPMHHGSTRPSPACKLAGPTKGFAVRPSARARYDAKDFSPVVYAGASST